MGSTLGRGGRRRRVLNEEIVAASGTHAAYRNSNPPSGSAQKTPRYGEAANAKHHARVSDFVPRKSRTIWVGWVAGMAGAACLVAMDACRDRIAAVAGAAMQASLSLSAPGSFASWCSSLLLLLGAAHAIYIYSLRRHRLSDYRGRYRVWLSAAVALFLLSANSVTGFHTVLAATATHLLGWSALPQHAVWWLVPGAVLLGAIVYGTLRDAWESRLARLTYLVSLAAFATGLAAFLGDATQLGISSSTASRVAPAALLVGNVSLLAMLAAYARFVSLDAEGLIAVRSEKVDKEPAAQPKSTAAVKAASQAAVTPSSASAPAKERELRVRPREADPPRESSRRKTSASSEWVDGRTPVKEYFEADDEAGADDRKLSKSERKRLRKIKSQVRRAA